ncbi:hypothetical protein HGRIS_011222 [Hohenbuehelia grisea]|uniref:Uncharacterized protein n=1 Tax=Hohenbuehelia grisea TaxID=104357 RepID=A0ABR3JVE7_9AGAR
MLPACLRVKFPAAWTGWHIPELTLTAAVAADDDDSVTAPTATVSVDPECTSDYSSDSPVLRASLNGLNVVLKFALREDLVPSLVEEAMLYTGALQPLQGAAVPRCYGLYGGQGEVGQTIACLILENWGECLQQPFHTLPLSLRCGTSFLASWTLPDHACEVRLRVLDCLGAIHRRGLWHGDFAERNVLERDGDIRIIDFDDARAHACACSMNFRPGSAPPDPDAFGCRQLWEICKADMRLWNE